MFLKNKNQTYVASNFLTGMSLIELLVSMAIIVFITAIFVTNYRTTNKRTDLVMAAQSLVADLHQAQNNSLGLLKYVDAVPAGGWGVSFDLYNNRNQYTLFADLETPGTYGSMVYNNAGEGDISKGARIVQLPPETEINAIRIGNSQSSRYSASVTFLPPDPKTYIYSSGATSTALEIDLKELNNNTIKTIRVNFLGLAEVSSD